MGQFVQLKYYRKLEYARAGTKTLTMDVFVSETSGENVPVVLWIYGSAWKFHVFHFYGPPILGLVNRGYAVASIDYRLTSQGFIFPAQIKDCKTAVRFLKANAQKYGLNTERVGTSGESAGGHLSALLALATDDPELEGELYPEYSSEVHAVCDIYGPTDLVKLDAQAKPEISLIVHDDPASPESRLVGGPLQQKKELAAKASPISYVKGKHPDEIPPFLMFHGDADPNVPYEQSVELYEALKQVGADVTFQTIPGANHSLEFFAEIEQQISVLVYDWVGVGTSKAFSSADVAMYNPIK